MQAMLLVLVQAFGTSAFEFECSLGTMLQLDAMVWRLKQIGAPKARFHYVHPLIPQACAAHVSTTHAQEFVLCLLLLLFSRDDFHQVAAGMPVSAMPACGVG